MEQMSLIEPSEAEAFFVAVPKLKQVLAQNWLNPDKLKLNENKDYFSVTFGPYVVVQMHGFPKPWISILRSPDEALRKRQPINDPSSVAEYEERICLALQSIIDSIPTDFSCCSRYNECSDALACLHPDKDFAAGCGYRKNLSKGKVFFGKNRNVD